MTAYTREFDLLTHEIGRTRENLQAFQERTAARFEQIDGRFDRLDGKLDSLDRKIDAKVDDLAKALPGIIVDAVHEANRDRDGKR